MDEMMNEPIFTHRYANGMLHIKLLIWKWRIYLMIGPRDGEVGLENPSVVSTQLPGEPLDVGTTSATSEGAWWIMELGDRDHDNLDN